MRQNVYIVWIDDDDSPSLKILKGIVKKHIEEKGYQAKIQYFVDIKNAELYFSDAKNKVDLFVIDYNIGDSSHLSGFDYLSKVRKEEKYRQYFILYSNNSEEVLKEELSQQVKNKELSELTNFEIISLENASEKEKRFERAIDVALSWWDELNAIRGIITSVNGKFDYYGRKILSSIPAFATIDWFDLDKNSYQKVINECKKVCKSNNVLDSEAINDKFDSWHNLRKMRNTFAHGVEKFDENLKKYFIENPVSLETIYSSDLVSYRQRVVDLSNVVDELITEMKRFFDCDLPSLV